VELSLFSGRSLLTMLHGIVLSGAALMGLAAALYALLTRPEAGSPADADRQARFLVPLTAVIAVSLWLTVIAGTWVIFPLYRAPPPEGAVDLTAYPRALLLANPATAWLHRFAMETKDHVPWITAMLATAAAFLSARYRGLALRDVSLRRLTTVLLVLCLGLVSYVALLGVFVNKVAPLE
jgi:heme A synthase